MFPARSVRGALLAYEGFNYFVGATNIAQQNGGSGWSAAWASGSGNIYGSIVTNSLGCSDGNNAVLVTSGNSMMVWSSASGSSATPNRTLGATLGSLAASNTSLPQMLWLSFVYRSLNSSTNGLWRQQNIAFFQSSAEYLDVGLPNISAANQATVLPVFSLWGAGKGLMSSSISSLAPAAQSTVSAAGSVPVLVVMQLMVDEFSGTPDQINVWLNPALDSEPETTPDLAYSEQDLTGVNIIRFQAGNTNATYGGAGIMQIDEFRIGETFADVVPYVMGLTNEPPTIGSQPASATVTATYTVTFSLTVSGTEPFSYQWYFNTNTVLAGQTNASLTIGSVDPTNVGAYCCIVTNLGGAATSQVATLTVLAPVVPGITMQPQDWTNAVGYGATFSVTATGTAPLQYQWHYSPGTLLTNETNAVLSFTIAQSNQSGGYWVVVTNKFGSVTSRVAYLTVSPFAPAQLPAFPGADGAGKLVTGGRGGAVYHVTKLDKNLNDNRAGTLRYGLSSISGPRTIVFDVAGVFWLGLYGAESNYDNGWDTTSRYSLPNDTTIAGQTAPGPVIIMGGLVKASGSNVILRNITCASGYGMRGFHVPPASPTVGDFPDSYVYDGIDIASHDIIIDHVTTLYNTDEAVSCNEASYNLTVQNCNISQGLNYPQVDSEMSNTWAGHALAQLWEGAPGGKTTVMNNLFAHMAGRLPALGGGATNDFRNNVIYNWLNTAGYESVATSYDNFINNFYLAGPGGYAPESRQSSNIVWKAGGTGIFNGYGLSAYIYASGNLMDINQNGSPNDTSSADASYVSGILQPAAFDVNLGLTLSAGDAFTNVLRHAGSRWWERPYDFRLGNTNAITTNDMNVYMNERLIRETVSGAGSIIAWADDPFNSDPAEGRIGGTSWRCAPM